MAATDATGAAIQVYTYGPYGEPNDWAGARFRYTGQAVLAELRLYHYKARVYDPLLGRFLQTDPVGYDVNLNLYLFTSGDPLNRVDPRGFEDCETRGASTCYSLGGGDAQSGFGDGGPASQEGEAGRVSVPHSIESAPDIEFGSRRAATRYLHQEEASRAQQDGNERAAFVYGQRGRWLIGDIGVGDAHESTAPPTRLGRPIQLRHGDRFLHWHAHSSAAGPGGLLSQQDYMVGASYRSRNGDLFIGMFVSDPTGLYGPPISYYDIQTGTRRGIQVIEPRYRGTPEDDR